jgi:hypothetical protein
LFPFVTCPSIKSSCSSGKCHLHLILKKHMALVEAVVWIALLYSIMAVGAGSLEQGFELRGLKDLVNQLLS